MSNQYKLVIAGDRAHLTEGRHYGTGYAFCKRDVNTFTTVEAQSSCKDFLNEQIYCEWTGKPMSVYGYQGTNKDIFEDGMGYLALSILDYKKPNGYATYTKFQQHKDNATKNLKACEGFMRVFEDLLKLDQKTELHQVGDNQFVAFVPLFWCKWTYLISLYTLLLRVSIESGWDGTGDALEFWKGVKSGDAFMLKDAMPKFHKMVEGKLPTISWGDVRSWHDFGICEVSF